MADVIKAQNSPSQTLSIFPTPAIDCDCINSEIFDKFGQWCQQSESQGYLLLLEFLKLFDETREFHENVTSIIKFPGQLSCDSRSG